MTVYLDHAATTPLREEAAHAWLDAAAQTGNASSIHADGQRARRLMAESREALAEAVGCEPIEVVFTSGGTESVNTALQGLWRAREDASQRALVLPDGEHHATLETVAWLEEHEQARVRPVPLDADGRIQADAFAHALPQAVFATALAANNECGTVNDVAVLAAHAADASVPLHVDAVASFGHLPVDFGRWRGQTRGPVGLCAMSLSAHKIGGPTGVGALVVSRAAAPLPLLHGGGQQRGLRPGTEDVAGAVAFAAAARAAMAEREAQAQRLASLGERLMRGILSAVPDARILGDRRDRVPGNVHVLFPGAPGETLLFLLDRGGVSVSTGSACQAGVSSPSHVVRAMGYTDAEASQVLRMSLGRTSTDEDVQRLLAVLPEAVARARAAAAPRS